MPPVGLHPPPAEDEPLADLQGLGAGQELFEERFDALRRVFGTGGRGGASVVVMWGV